jgi:hypothetical protein
MVALTNTFVELLLTCPLTLPSALTALNPLRIDTVVEADHDDQKRATMKSTQPGRP